LAVGKLIRVEGLKQLRGVAGIETIGLDLGDRFSQFCAVGGKGEILQEGRVPTTVVGMRRFFGGMEPVTVAVETGTHSPWVSRLLFSFGHKVLVAHARKLRLIYENRNKRDEVDARYLARIARLDPELLYPVRHRGESAQKDLAVLRSREALVAARTQMVNHVRGSVKSFGARLPSCSTPAFPKRVGEHVPESLKAALLPVLDCVSQLTEQIKEFDRRIHALIEESYPEAKQIAATRLDGPQHAPNRSGRLTKSANGSVAYRALSEPREQRTRPDQADGTMTEATKRGPPRRPT
jgi:transposase